MGVFVLFDLLENGVAFCIEGSGVPVEYGGCIVVIIVGDGVAVVVVGRVVFVGRGGSFWFRVLVLGVVFG